MSYTKNEIALSTLIGNINNTFYYIGEDGMAYYWPAVPKEQWTEPFILGNQKTDQHPYLTRRGSSLCGIGRTIQSPHGFLARRPRLPEALGAGYPSPQAVPQTRRYFGRGPLRRSA